VHTTVDYLSVNGPPSGSVSIHWGAFDITFRVASQCLCVCSSGPLAALILKFATVITDMVLPFPGNNLGKPRWLMAHGSRNSIRVLLGRRRWHPKWRVGSLCKCSNGAEPSRSRAGRTEGVRVKPELLPVLVAEPWLRCSRRPLHLDRDFCVGGQVQCLLLFIALLIRGLDLPLRHGGLDSLSFKLVSESRRPARSMSKSAICEKCSNLGMQLSGSPLWVRPVRG